jgi:tetratricopeptide (TPR) repeat protein
LFNKSLDFIGKNESEVRKLREAALEKISTAAQSLRESRGDKLDRTLFVTESIHSELLFTLGKPQEAWNRIEPLAKALENNSVPATVEGPVRLSTALSALQVAIQLGKFEWTDKLIELVSRQQGQESTAGVTQVFVMLAQRMQDRLQRLQAEGNLDAGRAMEESYETFLERIAQRETGQSVQSLAFIGQAFVELRRFDQAKSVLDRALIMAKESGSDHPHQLVVVKVAQARALSGMGKHDEALAAIDELMKTAGNIREVLVARGKILQAGGRLKEAEAHWASIIRGTSRQRPPEFYEAVYELAETQFSLPAAQRKAALKKTSVAINTILSRGHVTLTSEWREKLARQLKRIEDE